MANSRFYSSTALATTLTGAITNTGTSAPVASTAGFPGSVPFTLALDYGAANEELVEVTFVAGLTLTITRAIDGTAGSAHNPGAVVRHVSSARDFTDSRTHEAAVAAVHGITGTVVGTTDAQTLTNKTLTKALGSVQNITMFNAGASGITQIVGDSVNPNANRLEIKDNEVSLNIMTSIAGNGALKIIKQTADTSGTYRIRVTDNDGTTDRFAVLAGGAVTVTGQTASQVTLKVTAAASQSTDMFQVLDSASVTQFSVQSTGRTLANKGATVAQPNVTSGAVFQVGGPNVGYTGNLEQWVGPANTIVASVNEVGTMTVGDLVWTNGAPWTSYTPTWNGSTTDPVLGNGTLVARYRQLGKMVTVAITLTAGSTTTYGAGNYTFSLPFTSANFGDTIEGVAQMLPASGSRWPGQAQVGPSSTSVTPFLATSSTNPILSNWTPTVPQTFNTNGTCRLTFTYEIA